jgi:primosomal protein N' (replication factor Y)
LYEARCRQETQQMKSRLAEERDRCGISGTTIIGPVPAFVSRLRGKYRWQLVVRGTGLSEFLSAVDFRAGWMVEVDPVSLI